MLIYLIDDDFISLFLTEQILLTEGLAADIVPFDSAPAALAALLPRLGTCVPQVILLDLNMPVMDGWAFLQALEPHAAALQGRCRVYVLTSSLAHADTARARAHPLVAGIFHKPFDGDAVRAILAEATEQEG